MCEQLAAIRKALSDWAASFDPALVPAEVAVRVVGDAAAIEASAAALKALAAARAVDLGEFRSDGYRSAADGLASEIGIGPRAARDLVVTGRRLREQPALADAAKSGALSADKVALVANATEADASAAQRLIDLAGSAPLTALRDECARVKAAACDAEERRRRIHARRSLRTWTDLEGVWHLHASGNPEEGAQVMAALSPLIAERYEAARAAGERESRDAYAFDALVAMGCERSAADTVERPSSQGGRERRPRRRLGAAVKLLVRIDYDAWLRGVAAEGETCELVGYGPVAVSAVRQLVETGDPFVAAVLTRGKALVGVAHLGRQPNSYQRSALEWLYPSCAVQNCQTQAHLQADHRIDWARTHYTVLDLLDLLCWYHHGLKTRENWALVEGTGKRDFVPPSDARHPWHARPRAGNMRAYRPEVSLGEDRTWQSMKL
jgi:hypothetical protein